MKKAISFVAALTLVLLLFAGCAPTGVKLPTLDDYRGSAIFSTITTLWNSANSAVNEIPYFAALDGTEKNVVDLKDDKGAASDGKADVSAAFNEAIEELSGKNGYIHLDAGKYYLSADLTVPENVVLSFAPGALLVIETGKTLTVLSDKIIAASSAIFGGGGTVAKCENIDYGYPQWFGGYPNDGSDDGPAIEKALVAFGTVYFSSGTYEILSPVNIPQGRELSIIGQGQYDLVKFDIPSDIGFNYEREKGAARTELYITGVCFSGTARATAVSFHGSGRDGDDSTLIIKNFVYGSLGCLVDLAYARGSEFADCRGVLTVNSFKLGPGCNDTVFGSFLSLSGGPFIIADGGDVNDGYSRGLTLLNATSVWCYATDIYIKNYNDVTIEQSGYDLGCHSTSTENFEHRAAVVAEGVNGLRFAGNWVASNNATSGAEASSAALYRHGLLLKGCKNVNVSGCSIVNNCIGVAVEGDGVENANIVITGNKGEANSLHDFYLNNCDGVNLSYNFCYSYKYKKIENEIGGGNVSNTSIIGNSLGNDEYDLAEAVGADRSCKVENNLFRVR